MAMISREGICAAPNPDASTMLATRSAASTATAARKRRAGDKVVQGDPGDSLMVLVGVLSVDTSITEFSRQLLRKGRVLAPPLRVPIPLYGLSHALDIS